MRFLSNREKKELISNLPAGYEVSKKDEVKQDGDILLKNNEKFLIVKGGKILPHLKSVPASDYKCIIVDKGAIPFVAKGASVMRPGIVHIDDGFEKGEIVLIKEETKGVVLGIGFALFSSSDMKKMGKGKVVEPYHVAGDLFY